MMLNSTIDTSVYDTFSLFDDYCNCEEAVTNHWIYQACYKYCNFSSCPGIKNEILVADILEWIQLVIASIGLLTNLALIYCIAIIKSMHTEINYLLVNLSTADFLYLLFKLTRVATLKAADGDDANGFPFYTSILTVIFSNVSLVTIVAISVERFIVVCYPIAKKTVKCLRIPFIMMPIVIWSISLALSPLWIHYEVTLVEGKELNLNDSEAILELFKKIEKIEYFMYMVDEIIFVLSLVTVTAMYILIVKRLGKRPRGEDDRSQRYLVKQNKEVTMMLLINTVIFYVCLLPYTLLYLLRLAQVNNICVYSEDVNSIVRVFLILNSAVNPVVYAAFSRKFRKAFIESLYLIAGCFTKPQGDQQYPERMRYPEEEALSVVHHWI